MAATKNDELMDGTTAAAPKAPAPETAKMISAISRSSYSSLILAFTSKPGNTRAAW